MKLTSLIKELEYIKQEHGDVQVDLHISPDDSKEGGIRAYADFFIVAELYKDDQGNLENRVRISTFPY